MFDFNPLDVNSTNKTRCELWLATATKATNTLVGPTVFQKFGPYIPIWMTSNKLKLHCLIQAHAYFQ